VEDIVANAGKLSDKQLDYVRGLIKTMLDSGDGSGEREAKPKRPPRKAG
jgi:hypothetical protein